MEICESIIKCSIDELKDISFPFCKCVCMEIVLHDTSYEFLLNLKKNSNNLVFIESKSKSNNYFLNNSLSNITDSFVMYKSFSCQYNIDFNDYVNDLNSIFNLIADNLNFSPKNYIFFGLDNEFNLSLVFSVLNKESYFISDIRVFDNKNDVFNIYSPLNGSSVEKNSLNFFDLIEKEQYLPKGLLLSNVDTKDYSIKNYSIFMENLYKLSFNNFKNNLYLKIICKNEWEDSYISLQKLLDSICAIRDDKINSNFNELLSDYQEEIENLCSELDIEKKKNLRTKNHLKLVESSLNKEKTYNTDFNNNINSLKQGNANKSNEIQDFLLKFKDTYNKLNVLEKDNSDLISEVRILKEKVEVLEKENNVMGNKIFIVNNDKKDLISENTIFKEKISLLEKDNCNLISEIKSLQNTINNLNTQSHYFEMQIKNLKDKNSNLDEINKKNKKKIIEFSSSNSWKLTKPLRKFRNIFKK